MHKLFFIFISILFPFCAFSADNTQLLKTKMISDLEIIKNAFAVKYAPAEWKKIYADWDLDEEIEIAKAKILSTTPITVKDYQKILVSFLKSTRDYHVEISFHATAMAFLPFRIHGADGRYFIAWVDYENTALPIAKGDEIILFDGKPIANVIAELKKNEFGNPDSRTDQAKAEMLLTERLASLGQDVPQGNISITVKHLGSKKSSKYTLAWSSYPEEIKNDKVYPARKLAQVTPMDLQAPETKLSSHPMFKRQMKVPCYTSLRAAALKHYRKEVVAGIDEDGPMPLGSKVSFVPPLGQIIWQSSEQANFHAYLYTTSSGKTIGYIRIADFSGGVGGTVPASREFVELISKFEKESDALVIDQVNNPGGDVLHMYALASTLAIEPLALPKHRVTITQQDVLRAITLQGQAAKKTKSPVDLEDTISGYPITPELNASSQNYLQFIINEWNEGRTLTAPAHIFGIESLKPNEKGHYTKPILVLVNEMSLSCGDFFPAILQDNNRATIFGSRTAGAGGYVFVDSHPNLFGIEEYVITASIAERKDLNPIENLGVIPDILYTPTVEDLQNGFEGYRQAVQKAVERLF